MIIDIGTDVDESVVRWKYYNKDKWRYADIDDLIDLYESVVYCQDCRHYRSDGGAMMVCDITEMICNDTDFCSYGEKRK